MGEYDFILDNLRFSYSSVNSFGNCKHGFKLTYIDYEERVNNFFGEYGTFIHLVNENFFKKTLDAFELADFYKEHYTEHVISAPPPFPKGMAENYYNAGLDFYENFDFKREDYEILMIESSLETEFEGVKLIVKPDLVLRNKSTGKIILYDYKTAKFDKKKVEEYKKQMYLYSYFINEISHIQVDEIRIWFIRSKVESVIARDWAEESAVIRWFYDEIDKIKKESEWHPNLENTYFCSNLCSVRGVCGYFNNKI